jgi:hypothetical protein
MNGSSIFHHAPPVPFSDDNTAGGLLGQAQMHMACESSSEDNMATDPRFSTPKKQTRVKKEKFEEEDDDYIDEVPCYIYSVFDDSFRSYHHKYRIHRRRPPTNAVA